MFSLCVGLAVIDINLFIAMLTDTLDEVLSHPDVLTLLFEDVFQITGYIFIMIGLRQIVLRSMAED